MTMHEEEGRMVPAETETGVQAVGGVAVQMQQLRVDIGPDAVLLEVAQIQDEVIRERLMRLVEAREEHVREMDRMEQDREDARMRLAHEQEVAGMKLDHELAREELEKDSARADREQEDERKSKLLGMWMVCVVFLVMFACFMWGLMSGVPAGTLWVFSVFFVPCGFAVLARLIPGAGKKR